MKSVGIIIDLPNTADACQAMLKTMQAAIRTKIKDSIGIRLHKMEDQAELAALDGKSTKTAELRKMCNAEKIVETFDWIKVIRGIVSSKGFTSIVVPADWPSPHTDNVDLATLSGPKKCNL
jgi:hypothetical protein